MIQKPMTGTHGSVVDCKPQEHVFGSLQPVCVANAGLSCKEEIKSMCVYGQSACALVGCRVEDMSWVSCGTQQELDSIVIEFPSGFLLLNPRVGKTKSPGTWDIWKGQ